MTRLFIALVLLGRSACGAMGAADPPQTTLPQSALVMDTARGPVGFTVELAKTHPQPGYGLMFRKHVAPEEGMLFDFFGSDQRYFWMKNTLVPLDMLFIDASGHVATIAADAKPLSETPIPSRVPVRAVLEIAGGRAAALG